MKYNQIFALKSIIGTQANSLVNDEFFLKDYKQYEPKLERDFYLNYFLHKLLFEIKKIDVKGFLSIQFENSKNKDLFIQILDLEVLPAINNIIENAEYSSSYGPPSGDIKLDEDFILRDEIIINTKYQLSTFYNITTRKKLKNNLHKIHEIVSHFHADLINLQPKESFTPINWAAGPAKIGFIFSQLIDQKYINPPLKRNGEINTLELAINISKAFNIEGGGAIETLRRYLSVNDNKNKATKIKFEKQGFTLPDSEMI